MEPFCIILVEGIVTIPGTGFCVWPGLPVNRLPHKVRVGDKLELRRPDGSRSSTVLAGIMHANMLKDGSAWPIRFPETVRKEDVPVGTEVWWISTEAALD
jgi:hypothetical protein